LAAAGYATAGIWVAGGINWGVALGWTAAAASILTAYVRTLGAANGVGDFFAGLMAKHPRLWMLVAASLVYRHEALFDTRGVALAIGLGVLLLGSIVTGVMRLNRIAEALHARKDVAS